MSAFRTAAAAQRYAERRKREDEAPRLQTTVPRLESLRLEIDDSGPEAAAAQTTYVRHVVVARAPALFIVMCTDSSCEDGEHDLTRDILKGLTAGETRIEGTDRCNGRVGGVDCRRVLRYVAIATYRKDPESPTPHPSKG